MTTEQNPTYTVIEQCPDCRAVFPRITGGVCDTCEFWAEQFATQNQQPLLLCSTGIRGHLRRLTERFLPSLALVAPGEIPANVKIHSLGVVSLDDDGDAAARMLPPRMTAPAGAEVSL